jgi:CheY-like chemotaxis protein
MDETLHRVAVVTFSQKASVAYFLKGILDCDGFTVTAAFSSLGDLEEAVWRARPEAIVFDVRFPFAANWEKLQQVRERPALRNVPIVVTSSESRELFCAVGGSAAIDVFARTDDVGALAEALRRAIAAVAPRHAA